MLVHASVVKLFHHVMYLYLEDYFLFSSSETFEVLI